MQFYSISKCKNTEQANSSSARFKIVKPYSVLKDINLPIHIFTFQYYFTHFFYSITGT